jgi:carboxypeptidase Q
MRRALIALLAIGCISVRPEPRPTPQTQGATPGASPAGQAQATIKWSVDSAVVRSIVGEGMVHSHAGSDLAYLSDVIGPRLTASAGARRANDWTRDKFHEYGVDSEWTEAWTFGQGWERGPMTLTMIAPHVQQIFGASWAWAPGTDGPVTGPVVIVDATSPTDFAQRFAGRLRGAWALIRPPVPLTNPDGPTMTHADSLHADSALKAWSKLTEDQRKSIAQLPALLAAEHATGLLQDGAKDFGLLTMSGTPRALDAIAHVVIPHETYTMFYRLRQAGQPVTLRADITNTLTVDTLTAYNTVAEIRGAEHPDEVVLLGAHLDSWDLGTGTTDNGAGAIAVLEAARILAAAHIHPARTIRFALFTGEEQGLLGSTAYASDHEDELTKFQAVLVLDNGTGRITGVALQGRNELHDAWNTLFAPIASLGPFAVRQASKGGTDHLSFLPYGVPSFNYDQLTRGYNHTHHSQVDTFDHAVPDDLAQAATVMAVNAYELANAPALLARGQTAEGPQ